MLRKLFTPRPHWREQCEALGFGFHSIDGLYWEERYAYEFTAAQIDEIDDATLVCHQLYLHAMEEIVRKGRYEAFNLPQPFQELIEQSWVKRDQFGQFDLYSRFDFSWGGSGARYAGLADGNRLGSRGYAPPIAG